MIKLGTLATFTSFLGLGLVGCSAGQDSTESTTQHDTIGTICTPAQQAAALARMVSAPIVPPRSLGGLDLAGGDSWTGLTIESATQIACQATDLGKDEPNEIVGWGPNQEVQAEYNGQTHKIDFIQMNPGYTGKLDFKSRPDDDSRNVFGNGDPNYRNPFGQHTYSIGVGTPILKDGQPFLLNWASFDSQATELFDAMMYTFAPDLPSTQTNCRADQSCLARIGDGNAGLFGARPIGMYLYVNDSTAPQPAASIPGYLYSFFVKLSPFSSAQTFLKLDAEGPVATATNIGDRTPKVTCALKFGQPFSTFLDTCVNVLSDQNLDAFERQKLLGGIFQSQGDWVTQLSGISPGFALSTPSEGSPDGQDALAEIALDIRANGKQLNEYSRDGSTFTMGATAAIYREYARLVQNALQAELPADAPHYPLGAPECVLPDNADGKTWKPARGCTGMESFITPAQADTGNAGIDKLSVGPTQAKRLGIQTAIRPSDLIGAFCVDPGTFARCGNDGEDTLGADGALFKTTADHVAAVMGELMPKDARVPLFYVRQFAHAQVKYLRAASQFPTDLSKPEFDQFEPQPNEIIIETSDSDQDVVKYKSFFSETVLEQSGAVLAMKFHR